MANGPLSEEALISLIGVLVMILLSGMGLVTKYYLSRRNSPIRTTNNEGGNPTLRFGNLIAYFTSDG